MSSIEVKKIKQRVVNSVVQPLYIGGTADDGSDAKIIVETDGKVSIPQNFENITISSTANLPASTNIGSVSSTELSYLDGVTSSIQTQINAKAPLTSPALNGTPTSTTPTTGDNSTKIATTAFVLANGGGVFVANDSRVKTALNAGGNAPIYACRAWVQFNGSGTVSIKSSGNVSSVTDLGIGMYRVNFTTAMSDVNYCPVLGIAHYADTTYQGNIFYKQSSITTSSFQITTAANNNAETDFPAVSAAVFS